MFNFNLLFDLYHCDMTKAREYLHENLMALVTKELLANIDDTHHQDMIQDLFIKIDEWIALSVERWFNAKQTYMYLKVRINGFIMNYFKFEIGKNHIDTAYISVDVDDENNSYTLEDLMNLNKIPSLLLDWLNKCTETEKRIILLHNYMWIPVSKIEEITWIKKLNVYKRLKVGMQKLKYFLESKWVCYEDLV